MPPKQSTWKIGRLKELFVDRNPRIHAGLLVMWSHGRLCSTPTHKAWLSCLSRRFLADCLPAFSLFAIATLMPNCLSLAPSKRLGCAAFKVGPGLHQVSSMFHGANRNCTKDSCRTASLVYPTVLVYDPAWFAVAALDERRNVSLGLHTRKAPCLVFPKFRARPAYLPNFLIPPTPIAPWMTLTTIFLNI